MTDIFEDYFDESEALAQVDSGTGKQLSDLVRTLRNVEKQIEDAEIHMKALKAEKHKLSVENIPSLMDEMGVERLDVDGLTVERKMMVHASIPKDRKDEAFAWLRDNGLDDIIKNEVKVTFGKGEDNEAGAFLDDAVNKGLSVDNKKTIHPSTLKAVVKDEMSQGRMSEKDLEAFSVFSGIEAKIRRK